MLFNDLMVDCMTNFQQTLFLAVGTRKVKTLYQPPVSWLSSPEVRGAKGQEGVSWDSPAPPQLPL